eukprot:CAMPEP_0119119000 /NCGR_PEP_ID=MMETSP1310-20130426/678_1 /TAXON_ID=464262 /ORGANISM="Genus nov. species nov., Strain RCC2339" /LENGTH=2623 /DNA_ID=CAMNT_0007108411 /DNA_START=90 /DNA_END=7961 /DNA_ORIENTATION=-
MEFGKARFVAVVLALAVFGGAVRGVTDAELDTDYTDFFNSMIGLPDKDNNNDVPDVVSIYDHNPKWAHVGGGDVIQVCGCGFSNFDHVICMFDFKYTSFGSYITDDGNIICETPVFPKDDLKRESIPHNMRLDIVFDGRQKNQHVFVGWVRIGPELNPWTPLSDPNGVGQPAGRTDGGDQLEIYGYGFLDDAFSDGVSVFFDDVEVAGTVTDDNTIAVTVPPGNLNQNAEITVRFDGDIWCYLHAKATWHYGPIIEGLTPECAYVSGGTEMTIHGHFFDDPAVTSPFSQAPMIIVHAEDQDTFETFDYQKYQLFADSSRSTSTAIVFDAPDLVNFAFDSDLELADNPDYDEVFVERPLAVVQVFYQQVMSVTTQDHADFDADYLALGAPKLTYRYGVILDQDTIRVNGDLFATSDTAWPHRGGGDEVCLSACGLIEHYGAGVMDINVDEVTMFIRDSSGLVGTNNAFDGNSNFICEVELEISEDSTSANDWVCCARTAEIQSDDDGCSGPTATLYWGLNLENPFTGDVMDNDGEVLEIWTSAQTTVGPVFEADLLGPGSTSTLPGGRTSDFAEDNYHIISLAGQNDVSFSGWAFDYRGPQSTSTSLNDPWTSDDDEFNFDFSDTLGSYGVNQHSANAVATGQDNGVDDEMIIVSDNEITLDIPAHVFDETNAIIARFRTTITSCEGYAGVVHWGPFCQAFDNEHEYDSWLEPIFGHLDSDWGLSDHYVPVSGGTSLSAAGTLFQEGVGNEAIQVVFCQRFPDSGSRFSANAQQGSINPLGTASCTVYRRDGVTSGSASDISFTTPSYYESDGTRTFASYLWGDYFDVYMYFPIANDEVEFNADYIPDDYTAQKGTVLDSTTVVGWGNLNDEEYQMRKFCGNFRYGPVVDRPCFESPLGPASGLIPRNNGDGSIPEDPTAEGTTLTEVTLSGRFLDDNWYGTAHRATTNLHKVSFGSTASRPLTGSDVAASSLTAGVLWGPYDHFNTPRYQENGDVTVFFDTCNTSTSSSKVILWGPEITAVLAPALDGNFNDADLYGFLPAARYSDFGMQQFSSSGGNNNGLAVPSGAGTTLPVSVPYIPYVQDHYFLPGRSVNLDVKEEDAVKFFDYIREHGYPEHPAAKRGIDFNCNNFFDSPTDPDCKIVNPVVATGNAGDWGFDYIVIKGYGFEAYCEWEELQPGGADYCYYNDGGYVRAIIDGIPAPYTGILPCLNYGIGNAPTPPTSPVPPPPPFPSFPDVDPSISSGSFDTPVPPPPPPEVFPGFETDYNEKVYNCHELVVIIPPRPWGSRASVAVEFGQKCQEHDKQKPTEDGPQEYAFQNQPVREVDFTRVLTADQYLWFRPKLTSVSPDQFRTSLGDGAIRNFGYNGVEFTVYGYSFTNYFSYPPGWGVATQDPNQAIRCYLDNYLLETTAVSPTSVTCKVPDSLSGDELRRLRGEFNTDVSVHLEFNGFNEIVDANVRDAPNARGNLGILPVDDTDPSLGLQDTTTYNDDTHDWKVDDGLTVHLGPSCSVGTVTREFDPDGSTASDLLINIPAQFLRDCEPCGDVSTTGGQYCNRRWVPDTQGNLDGELYCMHRNIEVQMLYDDGSGQQIITLANLDTWNTSLTANNAFADDDEIVVYVQPLQTYSGISSLNCPTKATYRVIFDALVRDSAQNTIVCDGTTTFGPEVSDTSSDVSYGTRNGLRMHWGDVDSQITVTGVNFDNDEILATPNCNWQRVSGDSDNTVGSVVTTTATSVSAGSFVCVAPDFDLTVAERWQIRALLTVEFPGSANFVDCEEDVAYLYYGVPYLYNNYCEFPYPVTRVLADTDSAETDPDTLVTFSFVHTQFSQNFDDANCVFPGSYNRGSDNVFANLGNGIIDGVNCFIPVVDEPFQSISGIGIVFSESLLTTDLPNSRGDCNTANDEFCVFETLEGQFNSICYGPRTLAIDPCHVRMSYAAETKLQIDNWREDSANIDFHGYNFQDTFVDRVLCNKFVNGNNGDVTYDIASRNNIVSICSLEDLMFSKQCGDEEDELYLVYQHFSVEGDSDSSVSEYFERTTYDFVTSLSDSMPVVIQQTGDLVRYPLSFGPQLIDFDVAENAFWPMGSGSSNYIRAYEYGNLDLNVYVRYHLDFLGDNSENDGGNDDSLYQFGYEQVMGWYDNVGRSIRQEESNNAAYSMPQVGDKTFFYNQNTFSQSVLSDLNEDGVFRVRVPPAPFNTHATFSVIFDPHVDDKTTHTDAIHWKPYVTEISRSYAGASKKEVLAIKGEGFCRYHNVKANFLDVVVLDDEVIDHASCDVANDHVVICNTPYTKDAVISDVELHFSDRCTADLCSESSYDVVEVPDRFTFYGINEDFAPWEAPHTGDTDIVFPHIGLDNFDRVECIFDHDRPDEAVQVIVPAVVDDNSVVCRTPAVSLQDPEFNNNVGSRAVYPQIRLYHLPEYVPNCGENENVTLFPIFDIVRAPNPMLFGEPAPETVVNADTGDDFISRAEMPTTTLQMTGRFFNGFPNAQASEFSVEFSYYPVFSFWNNASRPDFSTIQRSSCSVQVDSVDEVDDPNFPGWSSQQLTFSFCDELVNALSDNSFDDGDYLDPAWGEYDVRVMFPGMTEYSRQAARFKVVLASASLVSISPVVLLASLLVALFWN